MLEPLTIAFSEGQQAAVIHIEVARDQIRSVMEPAIEELMAAVSEQGVGPAGPLFAHHIKQSSERFDFELGVPVAGSVAPVGRVRPGSLPATKVARSVYRGDYDGLYQAWDEFGRRAQEELTAQMEEEGLKPGATIWESYVKGPESDPDPRTWRTELYAVLDQV